MVLDGEVLDSVGVLDSLSSNVRLFADDTIVYLIIHSDADSQVPQKDLNKLANREMLWKMKFHPDKCEVVRVGRKRTLINHDYILHGKIFATANASKYLGVTISSDLRWNNHVNNITNKANKTLGLLKRNLKIRSALVKNAAYNTLVRSSLEYACSVWDPKTQGNIDQLEKVQRRAARFVQSDYDYKSIVTEMITKLSWDSLQVRRQAYRLGIFYKIHYGLVALGAAQLGMQRQQRASRHTHSLAYEVPLSRTNYYMYSFVSRTIRNWNNLPDAIVRAPTIDHFKNNLWAHIHNV